LGAAFESIASLHLRGLKKGIASLLWRGLKKGIASFALARFKKRVLLQLFGLWSLICCFFLLF
jgi:hypothetical protein